MSDFLYFYRNKLHTKPDAYLLFLLRPICKKHCRESRHSPRQLGPTFAIQAVPTSRIRSQRPSILNAGHPALLSCPVLSHPTVSSCPDVLSYPVVSHPTLFCSVLIFPVVSRSAVSSCPVVLHFTVPPSALCCPSHPARRPFDVLHRRTVSRFRTAMCVVFPHSSEIGRNGVTDRLITSTE